MLQSVSPATSYSIRQRLSRPALQAGRSAPPPFQQQQAPFVCDDSEPNNNNHNNSSSNTTDNTTDNATASSSINNPMSDDARNNLDLGSDDEGDGKGGKSKSRRELPAGAVQTLKAWLLAPEHFTHPYPTPQDQAMLMQKTGIDKKQLKNWFTNARRRIWKPMLKKQIEQGKLTTTGVSIPGAVPGLMVPALAGATPLDNPHSVQAMRMHYQQAVQGQQQQVAAQPAPPAQVDAYGNQVYVQHHHIQQQPQHQPPPQDQSPQASALPQYFLPSAADSAQSPLAIHPSNSIGSLPPMSGGAPPSSSGRGQLNKTDSHAVLMELFARDQDLVRQATESARMKAAAKKQDGQPAGAPGQSLGGGADGVSTQHPMNKSNSSQSRLTSVPSLNSWPHFSSISSLNNLGNMPGVKSITSMSGVDLANQGNVNKMGNLAQVKSMESMGKNDSYAFLEVFFGDRSLGSMNNLSSRGGGGLGMAGGNSGGLAAKGKRDREEDDDVGLSLDDEGPSTTQSSMEQEMGAPDPMSAAPQPAPLTDKDGNDTGTLKRAYDDALAARGLMSVSRSSEKLTDLALPAKMQRSLSQEYIRQRENPNPQQFGQFSYTPPPAPADEQSPTSGSSEGGARQYAGQHPGEPGQQQQSFRHSYGSSENGGPNASVEVAAATKCAICHETNVDTQLRPCGHLFHEKCLKPSLQSPVGVPKCPVDHIAMQSALLAVPTDDPQPSSSTPQPKWSISNAGNTQGVVSEGV